MLLAEPTASLQGAKAKAKHSPEQPGPGKSRTPAQNNDTFLATSTALWLYAATSTAAVTSITSCRNQHLGGRAGSIPLLPDGHLLSQQALCQISACTTRQTNVPSQSQD